MERRNLKDAQKRAIFARLEHTRIMLRALLKDRSLPQSVRFHMSMELNTLPRKSTKTKINNRCVSTGRAKGVYRLFKCSRICMRELVAMGALPGVKKLAGKKKNIHMDPISNLLCNIRNGIMAQKTYVSVPYSKTLWSVAHVFTFARVY